MPAEAYLRLLAVIGFGFHPWFFLAGVPADLAALDRRTDVPGGLRAFAQYVLIPLVVVYLAILTVYLARIVATRVWPGGWIGYLVSALAALGILSLLLIHPERDRPDSRWIDRYARGFWIAILPPTAMLLLAAWKRISQYGITERRYLLAVLAVWLGAIAIHYALTRARDIRRIPLTLAILAFVTFVGPWSAYDVSRASQVGRLERLLAANGILEGGAITPAPRSVPAEDRREITAALDYLVRVHGTAAIDPWFGGRLATIDTVAAGTGPSDRYEARRRTALLLRHIGVEPLEGSPGRPAYEHFAARRDPVRDIAGFEHALAGMDLRGAARTVAGEEVTVSIDKAARRLEIGRGGRPRLDVSLDPLIERARRGADPSDRTVAADSLRLDLEPPGMTVRIYLDGLTVRAVGDSLTVDATLGTVYLRWRDSTPP